MILDEHLWPRHPYCNLANLRPVEPAKVTVDQIVANAGERLAGNAVRYRIMGRAARTLAEVWGLVPVNEKKVPFAGRTFPWRT